MKRQTRLVGAVLVLLLGLATFLPGPVGAAPSFSIGATSASPNPVNRGATTTITTSVTNTGTAASGIIIDMEIYDAAGVKVNQGTPSGQQYTPGQSFAAGETKTLLPRAVPWTLAGGAVAAAVVGTSFGFSARSLSTQADKAHFETDALSLHARATGQARIANGAFVGAGALLAGAVVTYVLNQRVQW